MLPFILILRVLAFKHFQTGFLVSTVQKIYKWTWHTRGQCYYRAQTRSSLNNRICGKACLTHRTYKLPQVQGNVISSKGMLLTSYNKIIFLYTPTHLQTKASLQGNWMKRSYKKCINIICVLLYITRIDEKGQRDCWRLGKTHPEHRNHLMKSLSAKQLIRVYTLLNMQ